MKTTVDKKLLEQAVEALACAYINNPTLAKLRAALAEPAVEELVIDRQTEWVTGAELASPPPAEVPLLTELDIALMWGEESLDTTSPESCYVLGVLRGEAAVRRKAGL